ncbi:ABC transporter ATP-binding protein [Adlercreutzia sp. ZJ176]|uniref:ABC transporter ATP-binding protein n=3 Tax=unclassified Adlercreutzia TaxID=2636013 RepID=UPI001F15438D|nr:ABC transporter ATP-binding protein [Adlercreutzia sp. ZJ176]
MRIARYLLEHKLALLMVIVLLIGQAAADLSLPRLTSDIVDVGIQQQGVEHVAADELTERTFEIACMMSSEDDEELLRSSYDADEGAWRLNDAGRERIEELDRLLTLPLIAAHGAQGLADGVDLDQLLAAYQAGQLPKSEVLSAVEAAREAMTDVEESIVEQQGVAAARAEYEALGYDLSGMQMGYLLRTGAAMLGLAAAGAALAVLVGLVASRTGAAIGRDLRERLFTRVMEFSEGDIGRFSAASLITRGTNDIQLIQMMSIMLMRMVLYAPVLAVGGIVMVMSTNASMGWVIVVAIAAVFAVIAVLFKVVMPKFRIMQSLIDRVNLVAREMLTGLPVVRAFDREDFEEERFDVASTHLMRTQLFTNRAMTFMMPALMLIMNVTSIGIVWIGGLYVDSGVIQTGDLIAFITYSMVIIMSFLMIGMISIMLPRAEVAAGRINEVLATPPSVTDPASPVRGVRGAGEPAAGEPADASAVPPAAGEPAGEPVVPPAAGGPAGAPAASPAPGAPRGRGARIVFDDVSFRYDDASEYVLEHVSFTAEPGSTLAVIGSTGSGKSTVCKLIERFYDVSAGAVRLDGVDVRAMAQSDLRGQIGYVPQKAFLFTGTVESNVAYADEGMRASRVDEALSVAQAAGFVAEKAGGLDAPISQGGTNVSGGQRQRLCIARALAADARVLLFDDSFSALDYKTDADLRAALDAHAGGVTRVIVAQRISTIQTADCIVVLDEGRVVGKGTHEELMRDCEEYRAIALSQLSEEELGMGGDAA